MRILLPTIRDPDQIGGGGTHLTMLVAGLKEAGNEAQGLYLTGSMPRLARNLGLVWPAGVLNRLKTGWGMVYSADARGRLLATVTSRELERTHERGTPWEVLNAQEVYSVPFLREVADRHRIPLVLTLHGYPVYESDSEGYATGSQMGRHYLMRAEMRALRLADAIVTVDTRLYHHALRLVPERADSVSVLLNFIDTTTFAPAADPAEEARLRRESRTAWDIPDDKTVLLCPRRLVKKNGVVYPSLALAAMEPEDRRRFLLLHAGDGGERDAIEAVVRENHLEDGVRLLGGQDRDAIRQLYRLADIVLVPSVHSENVEEATSLSALEAMASGRPLVAGNVGGLAEMVDDGQNGLLVPADPAALAAAILRLAGDRELGVRLAAAARDYVITKHSHMTAAAAYARIYEAAIARRTSASGAAGRTSETAPEGGADAPPPAWPSISVLGFTLDLIGLDEAARWVIGQAGSRDEAPHPQAAQSPTEAVQGFTAPSEPTRLVFSFNPESIVRAQRDPAVAEAFLAADLCLPDGVGAVWAATRQGALYGAQGSGGPHGEPERVPGVELARLVLEMAAEERLPVFFLGAAPGVADEAVARLLEELPALSVAGTHDGYFSATEEGRVVNLVRASGAHILLAAMGAPRQELFLYRRRLELGVPVALGLGGTFDVWSGQVKRAPEWAQRAKAEWLYRLAADPRRLRRQLVLPRFAAQVLWWSPEDYGPPRRGRARDISRPDTQRRQAAEE